VVRGTASAQAGVAAVYYQIDTGEAQLASGTTKWAFTNDLLPGTHLIIAWCVDANSVSSAQARTILDAPKGFPSVTIKAPPPNAVLTEFPTNLTGTAQGCAGVAAVYFQVNNGLVQIAEGINAWTITLAADDLVPGTNTVGVWCQDNQGGQSSKLSRQYIHQVLVPLAVVTNGMGKVTPVLNGKLLAVGRNSTLTATPATGQVFSNWVGLSDSGGFTNTAPTLTFRMETNLVIQANFVTNPFIAAKGTYCGLFIEADGIKQESSGFFDLTLTDRGTYSARLTMGAAVYPFSGQFDLSGVTTQTVALVGQRFDQLSGGWFIGTRPVLHAYPVSLTTAGTLNLADSSDRLVGQVTRGTNGSLVDFVADLQANRPPAWNSANPCPYQGQYTLIVPGAADAAASPGGTGFGTVTVGVDGKLTFRGSLADNTTVSQTVRLSKEGLWPLYVPLYSGAGSILSWVSVSTNSSPFNLSGELSWIKPTNAIVVGVNYYPLGFTNLVPLEGSGYQPPGTHAVLDFTNGEVIFTGGNLSAPFTNQVVLGANNIVTNLSSNPLTLKINVSNGQFDGNFTAPGANKSTSFKGVVLQGQNFGAGFFLGTNQSGMVLFGPAGL
jgi:hypothetical protein